MRTALDPVRLEVQRTRAQGRKRRLRRGIDRWIRDVRWFRRPRRKVLLLAFTFTDARHEAALGAIRNLWHQYRKMDEQPTYFAWLELQQRGAVHYHVLLVDPPFALERDARRWFTRHWPHSAIQPHVQTKRPEWFTREAAGYVGAYAKKMGRKAYQQDYDELPSALRTFVCDRLWAPAAEHERHEDKLITVCTKPGEPWYVQIENIWAYEARIHVTEGRWCGPVCGLRRVA